MALLLSLCLDSNGTEGLYRTSLRDMPGCFTIRLSLSNSLNFSFIPSLHLSVSDSPSLSQTHSIPNVRSVSEKLKQLFNTAENKSDKAYGDTKQTFTQPLSRIFPLS